MPVSRKWLLWVLALCLLGAGGFWLIQPWAVLGSAQLAQAGIILLPQARALPDAALGTADGQPFGADFFKGRWTLVLFGYTFCPDICPTTLSELRRIRAALPAEVRDRLGVTMVSVDPQRDSPERMQQYVTYFDPTFIGMTGEMEEIQKASAAMGLPFIPGDTSKQNYTVDHSGHLGLIDPQGRQVGYARGPLREAQLIEQLPALLRLDSVP